MGEIFRHWFLVTSVIIGFYLGGLRGALLWTIPNGLDRAFFIGVWWGKYYFSWKELRLDIRYLPPYLQFGFIFLIFQPALLRLST